MELSDDLQRQAENMALLIDSIYTGKQPGDREKVAFVLLSELDEKTKALFNRVCGILTRKRSRGRKNGQ